MRARTGCACVLQLLRPLGPASLAVAAELAQPASRAVVDEYHIDPATGAYKLASPANDLLRYLRKQGVTTALLPDVTAAGTSTPVTRATKVRKVAV